MDTLSRRSDSLWAVTVAMPHVRLLDIQSAQQCDEVLSKVCEARATSDMAPRTQEWNQHPYRRYRQLWPQLQIHDGILCRHYSPDPTHEPVTVPILPESLRHHALLRCHNIPTAGHQGADKTLARLKTGAYWIGVAQDIEQHCRECVVCQRSCSNPCSTHKCSYRASMTDDSR